MKICCTVLLGPGCESHVGEAIASVREQVDEFLFIESGGGQPALDAATAAAGDTAVCEVPYLWLGDYGAARQFALEQARGLGCDYALTLDPDERLALAPDFRAVIGRHPEADVWILPDRATGYFKERVIRTNTRAFWHGQVCEFLDGREVAGARLPGYFWELPKDTAGEARRWARGVVACTAMIDAGDDCYRWRRHRGTCLMGLGRQAEALADYEAALPLALNTHETAWMRYLLCEQYVLAGRATEARELAARGLADHAGFIPEFGWILAYTDQEANPQNASRWAQLVTSSPPDRTRVGFRGQRCQQGARQLLQALHGAQPEDMPQGIGVRPVQAPPGLGTVHVMECP
jgi:hypothetical protein